jgi:hypothetical protein
MPEIGRVHAADLRAAPCFIQKAVLRSTPVDFMSRIILLLAGICCFTCIGAATASIDASSVQTSSGGTYWCPMHPNIRGQKGDACRICHMALVPAPPPDFRPYGLDVETLPRAPVVGSKTEIRLTIIDPRTQAAVNDFEVVHEHLLHLFVLSQDLEYFAHVHPTKRPDGTFIYTHVFPGAGPYRLIADFLPVGGVPQLLQRTIVTAGYTGSLVPKTRLVPDGQEKVVEDLRVRLSMPPPVGGREQLVTFEFSDSHSGAPISDLEPYLGAVGHLLYVSSDLEVATHSHPVADMSASVGPVIVFQALFPRAGTYRLWVQVQRRGRVVVVPFTVAVQSPDEIRVR